MFRASACCVRRQEARRIFPEKNRQPNEAFQSSFHLLRLAIAAVYRVDSRADFKFTIYQQHDRLINVLLHKTFFYANWLTHLTTLLNSRTASKYRLRRLKLATTLGTAQTHTR